MSKDYYNILGVDKNADQESIKTAFRKKAHQYHPDKGGDEEKFKEINEAYQILGNVDKRQKYDQYGSAAFSGAGQGFSSQGFNMNFEDLNDIFSGFGDWFGFGSSGMNYESKAKRQDLEMSINISFMEAALGTEKEISYERMGACQECQGSGAKKGTELENCPTCSGRGKISRIQRTILGAMQMESICSDCQGRGKKPKQYCSHCRGQGSAREKLKFKVKIPAGIDNGESIRIPNKGEIDALNSRAGDLYLRIIISEHKHFKRQGSDIFTQETINFSQAAAGDKIDIETIKGPVKLKIPEGTQPGTKFRLKDKGLAKIRGRGFGDHYVLIKIKIPKGLSKKQKKALEELNI